MNELNATRYVTKSHQQHHNNLFVISFSFSFGSMDRPDHIYEKKLLMMIIQKIIINAYGNAYGLFVLGILFIRFDSFKLE